MCIDGLSHDDVVQLNGHVAMRGESALEDGVKETCPEGGMEVVNQDVSVDILGGGHEEGATSGGTSVRAAKKV